MCEHLGVWYGIKPLLEQWVSSGHIKVTFSDFSKFVSSEAGVLYRFEKVFELKSKPCTQSWNW